MYLSQRQRNKSLLPLFQSNKRKSGLKEMRSGLKKRKSGPKKMRTNPRMVRSLTISQTGLEVATQIARHG